MAEEWLPCPSCEGIYEVSSFGRIRRLKPAMGATSGKLLKPWKSGGYYYVGLSTKSKVVKRTVHSLVCEAFHGPAPSSKHEVAHWDDNKLNNIAKNLRWATKRDNYDDAVRNGRMDHPKLSEDSVLKIRNLADRGFSCYRLARIFNVNEKTIWDVIKGINWSHV